MVQVMIIENGCNNSKPYLRACGEWSMAAGLLPETSGTGRNGMVEEGNIFDISEDGYFGELFIPAGSTLRAKKDCPGQNIMNYKLMFE